MLWLSAFTAVFCRIDPALSLEHRELLETIGAGEALGWSWLFPPYRWHFSARSHGVTDAVAFDARVLRQFAEANHGFGYELAMRVGQVMLQRLQATREQLVHFHDAIKEG